MKHEIDSIDRQIISALRTNARLPISEISKLVNLSPAPVQRRIAKLEQQRVIRGYSAIIDESKTGALESFVEVRLHGGTETSEVSEIIQQISEAEEFYTLSGEPDILVRIYADDVDHLQRIVNTIRRTGKVAGTKTLIVMHSWHRKFESVNFLELRKLQS